MGRRQYILAIDQGTTSTRVLLVDIHKPLSQQVVSQGQADVPQHFVRPGWVEHDLTEIWQSVCQAAHKAFANAAIDAQDIAAISIANQRETTCVWHPDGTPLARAIVWQDRRTQKLCERLKSHEPAIKEKTGLRLDPYFSASKIAWLIANQPGLKARVKTKNVCFGTIDSWLIYKLCGHKTFATDATNAARTLFYDIHRGEWDHELIGLWAELPMSALPEVLPSDALFGRTLNAAPFKDGVPVTGVAGDQQAAMVGQGLIEAGQAKLTLGTGAFLMLHTGDEAKTNDHGLITTLGIVTKKSRSYALEGSAFIAGAMVAWLRDGLGIIKVSDDIFKLAQQVNDTGGVTVVPALAGLGAPHWRPGAKGIICGLSRSTTAAHIARAALQGVALQNAELLLAMKNEVGQSHTRQEAVDTVRVDGGAARNDLLVQMHSDFCRAPIARPVMLELTGLGAAALGALGVGAITSLQQSQKLWQQDRVFEPTQDTGGHAEIWASYRRAVAVA